ncbi:MAG: hypothetical protein AB7V13_10750 [Pseudorhodoplanes sp.]|uniref:hypothetical protein n=1 Tax=Pseudorhodoplanes sp. TaxID=1934341 RepID=UPI003D0CF6DF
MTDRAAILNAVLGKPWAAGARGPEAFDCWHLAVHVQLVLAGRVLPQVVMPAQPSWAWMIDAIERHPERARWRLVSPDPMGLIRAGDLALALMARVDRPAHVGIHLKRERAILHCDQAYGVVADGVADLRRKGWTRLRFYEPL